ncbi:MAG TPA: NAD(P)/FAD-dependent oxidoreductase [Woeseiaceae bacterium]|nr:NAD(P)/FAD-dependent oxidoreductase [Woeseiaceae bacterium]
MPETVAARLETQMNGCRLRILIVGAGIAGATLAALLHRHGERPAIIERGSNTADGGYMLGLMPLGARVLHGLQLTEAYQRASVAVTTYEAFDRNGGLIRSYSLADLVDRFGSWRGVERGVLLSLLRDACGPICFETTVKDIIEREKSVTAIFPDGSRAGFDLIVGADGIHSSTRARIVPDDKVEEFDTGWGGFVMWSTPKNFAGGTYSELWSTGWGLGLYPVPGRVGMFLAGRDGKLSETDGEAYAAELEQRLAAGPFLDALQARDATIRPTYWRMVDYRSSIWSRGRVVLLGDAAAAFLPTAGVGASAAMDSAAALADELSRAESARMNFALELYEKRQRHRVEATEKNSRDLSKLMFVNSAPAAWARDKLMEFYSLKHLINDISKVMAGA